MEPIFTWLDELPGFAKFLVVVGTCYVAIKLFFGYLPVEWICATCGKRHTTYQGLWSDPPEGWKKYYLDHQYYREPYVKCERHAK